MLNETKWDKIIKVISKENKWDKIIKVISKENNEILTEKNGGQKTYLQLC